MSFFDSFMDTFKGSKPNGDNSNAQESLAKQQNAYAGMQAPALQRVTPQEATASDVGPSAMGGVQTNPANNQEQTAQMAALSNLAANGGRNAASDANLARIQQNENANAKGQQGAIMQGMAARGMSGSGSNLLAQLSNSQNATNNQSAEDLGVRGQEANTALSAGQGAAAIGSNMENQQFGQQAAKAQAADAINRYNAGQRTGVSEYNAGAGNEAQRFNSGLGQAEFGDKMGIAAGTAGVNQNATNYWSKKYGEDTRASGGMLGGLMGLGGTLGAAAMKAGGGGGTSLSSATGLAGAGGAGGTGYASAGGDAAAYGGDAATYGGDAVDGAQILAAWGGKTPGTAVVPGNSTLNDFVPIMSSPGEVHVPRTLVQGGTPNQIGQFVKHAPAINPNPDKNREAMLGALKNISKRRAA